MIMAESGAGGLLPPAADGLVHDAAYDAGYDQVTRELAWARARGWAPTERELTVVLMRAVKVYAAVRGGKSVAGQRPEWLRGRVDALRMLLRQGMGDLAEHNER
jgi:hypothetical protein